MNYSELEYDFPGSSVEREIGYGMTIAFLSFYEHKEEVSLFSTSLR